MCEQIYSDAKPVSDNTMPSNPPQKEFSSGITIIAEPIDVIANIGSYVNLSVSVRAINPTYQWFDKDGNQIAGMRRNSLFLGPVREEDFGFYRLAITDEITKQTVLTRWVELKKMSQTINSNPTTQATAPNLLMAPKGGSYQQGDTVRLEAHFENATHYQWYKDGMKLEGCDGNTLIINNASLHNTGDYTILTSNGSSDYGSAKTKIIIY